MIRFQPDSLLEGGLRPFYMMASSAWVYAEILAPDFRFALFTVLALAVAGGLVWRGYLWHSFRSDPFWALVVFFLLCMVAWLASTGNGRYFMSGMILIGLLLVAAIARLTVGFDKKLLLLTIVSFMQWLAISQNSPWNRFDSYEWVPWRDHAYVQLDRSDLQRYEGSVMVTLQPQSYSAVAPFFPPGVRWVNTSVFEGADLTNPASRFGKLRAMLKSAQEIYVLQKTHPSASDASGRPAQGAVDAMNGALRRYGLVLLGSQRCHFIASETMQKITMLASTKAGGESSALLKLAGFWVCEARVSDVTVDERVEKDPVLQLAERSFALLEHACPRMFPPGQVALRNHGAGYARIYASSDSVVIYDEKDAALYVKYQRALNPQRIGSSSELIEMRDKGCSLRLQGRGSPWGWVD